MVRLAATIVLLHWAILIAPGANVLAVLQLAASGQRRAAVGAALGIATVAVTWAALALVGVHALFSALPALRIALQCIGGAYLLHVATRLWRIGGLTAAGAATATSLRAGFSVGVLANVANPKSALFFGSVFAAALPAAPDAEVVVLCLALVLVNALAWHLALAWVFSRPAAQRRYARHKRALARIGAVLLGAFAGRMLFGAALDALSAAGER